MKRPILSAGLIVGALVPTLGLTGCRQTDKSVTVTKKDKPDDPTAWTDKDLAKGKSDDGTNPGAMPPSSGLRGTWSSEGQDIERSLGVGR